VLACEWYVVPVLETELAQAALGGRAHRLVPMTRTLRPDVQHFIRSQPITTRFGIIAATPEWERRMLAAVRRLHPLRAPPLTASVTDGRKIADTVNGADALIIGPLAWSALRAFQVLRKPSAEFIYVPDAATIRRLRLRLSKASHEPDWALSPQCRRA
jgi:hypothetical protein